MPGSPVILQVKGDTHFVVRNPDECNLFADMGCRLPPPVPPEQTPRLLKAREGNFARLLNDIREQVLKIVKSDEIIEHSCGSCKGNARAACSLASH